MFREIGSIFLILSFFVSGCAQSMLSEQRIEPPKKEASLHDWIAYYESQFKTHGTETTKPDANAPDVAWEAYWLVKMDRNTKHNKLLIRIITIVMGVSSLLSLIQTTNAQ